MIRLCTMLALVSVVAADACGDLPRFPICTNEFLQTNPTVCGNIVLWMDRRNDSNNWDIYAKDLSSGVEAAISMDVVPEEWFPASNGQVVVWSFGMNRSTIRAKELTSGNTFDISDQALSGCDIDANTVVWGDCRNGVYSDIYGYNLTSGTDFPICTDPANQYGAAISGNIVVWMDFRNIKTKSIDIYGYNLTTQTEFPVCTHEAWQDNPDVGNGVVVWIDWRNQYGGVHGRDIYGYDTATGTEFPICLGDWSKNGATVSNGFVVWTDYRNGNGDIYGYELSTGNEFPICTDPLSQGLWRGFDGNLVVWVEHDIGEGDIYGAYIPEPATLSLLAAGVGAIWLKRRRR